MGKQKKKTPLRSILFASNRCKNGLPTMSSDTFSFSDDTPWQIMFLLYLSTLLCLPLLLHIHQFPPTPDQGGIMHPTCNWVKGTNQMGCIKSSLVRLGLPRGFRESLYSPVFGRVFFMQSEKKIGLLMGMGKLG